MANNAAFKDSLPPFFLAPVRVNQRHVTLTLPKEVTAALDVSRESVYCTMVDGVLQISGRQPNVAIPVLSLSPDAFVKQS